MKWHEIHDNIVKTYRYLMKSGWTAEELFRLVEKPESFEKEYHEALRWHARQEAMFQRVATT